MRLTCAGCGKTPEELPEYSPASTGIDLPPSSYVWAEEGTLDQHTGRFACTRCYIAMGQPTAPGGWKA